MKLTNKKLYSLLLVSVALALGALYELFEFIEDQVFKPQFKNQPSLIDTNLDLFSDLAGGILAVLGFYERGECLCGMPPYGVRFQAPQFF